MAHSHARLDEEHRCIATKCPGVMYDPSDKYGRYAYWRRGGHDRQWHWFATPSRKWAKAEKQKKERK